MNFDFVFGVWQARTLTGALIYGEIDFAFRR